MNNAQDAQHEIGTISPIKSELKKSHSYELENKFPLCLGDKEISQRASKWD